MFLSLGLVCLAFGLSAATLQECQPIYYAPAGSANVLRHDQFSESQQRQWQGQRGMMAIVVSLRDRLSRENYLILAWNVGG